MSFFENWHADLDFGLECYDDVAENSSFETNIF